MHIENCALKDIYLHWHGFYRYDTMFSYRENIAIFLTILLLSFIGDFDHSFN